jgi:hypothetical protein
LRTKDASSANFCPKKNKDHQKGKNKKKNKKRGLMRSEAIINGSARRLL